MSSSMQKADDDSRRITNLADGQIARWFRLQPEPATKRSGDCRCEPRWKKPNAFRALHERPGAFIIPNPWDAGTAKLLAAMGFEALATTSLGLANTLGSATVSLDAIIENCRMIADATDLPVNADLENCGADDPKSRGESDPRAPPKPAASAARSRILTGDPRRTDLRFPARRRARAGRRRSCARPALPVHADGARRKLPARPQRSRRHDQASAGVRGRWRRRAVFARPVRHRHHPHRGVVGRQSRSIW